MVSTRQMATSSGINGSFSTNNSNNNNVTGGINNNGISITQGNLFNNVQNSGLYELTVTRNSVVTRASQSSLVGGATISATSTAVITRYAQQRTLSMHLYDEMPSCSNSARTNQNCNNIFRATTQEVIPTQLLDLPTEILLKIFGYIGFKKVSQCRAVSSKMNEVCMLLLNSTFSKLINTTYNRFHAIKANMPRRESARRNHPLACECDIIETCYMRLSLLQMTLGKHIERGHCCFFPGAILDEVYTIMNYISNTPHLQRPYRVTDELFDLSTMAMEYFRDRVEPSLPGIAYFNKDYYKLPTIPKRPQMAITSDLSDSSSNEPPQNHMVLRKGIRKIKQGMKIYNNQLSVLRTELRNCKRKSADQGKQVTETQKLLTEQQKQMLEYANRLDEYDKKNEEISRKFSTLLQELNKCKTELQFWRSKSPAIPVCISCNQKLTPVLPAEDFQALVNQGVNPEDIIINLNDETDAESDINMSDNQISIALNKEFVFPDEETTAKLLAVNTATKNLKRKIENGSSSCSSSRFNHISPSTDTDLTKTSNPNTSVIGNGIIDTLNAKSNAINAKQQLQSTTTTTKAPAAGTQQQQEKQFAHNGYSTKLFYGNQHQRGGVIVSPVSVHKKSGTVITNSLTASATNNDNAIDATSAIMLCGAGAANSNSNSGVNEEVFLHETKKARRVQKATRFVNSNGKRSK